MWKWVVLALVITVVIIGIYTLYPKEKDYSTAERSKLRLKKLRAKPNKTATESFEQGSIIQTMAMDENNWRNPDLLRETTTQYINTLNRMEQNDEGTMFMLDRIDDFGQQIYNTDYYYEIGPEDIVYNFYHRFNDAEDLIVNRSVKSRIAEAETDSQSKLETSKKFLKISSVTTSDAQNVHDTNVNKDMNQTLNILRSNEGIVNISASLLEVSQWLLGLPPSDKRTYAIAALTEALKDETITTFDSTEGEILSLVWCRIKSKNNRAKKDLLLESLYTMMADCWDKTSLVCLSGRCTRYMQSLLLLDYNENVGAAMTKEAYKNQIYDETRKIIEIVTAKWVISNDPMKNAVGESYRGKTTVEPDPTLEHVFKEEVKDLINENMSKYGDKLSESEIKRLTIECYASIDL